MSKTIYPENGFDDQGYGTITCGDVKCVIHRQKGLSLERTVLENLDRFEEVWERVWKRMQAFLNEPTLHDETSSEDRTTREYRFMRLVTRFMFLLEDSMRRRPRERAFSESARNPERCEMADTWDKEKQYDDEISPLMKKIIEVCYKYKIPVACTFQIAQSEGGPAYCTTTLPFPCQSPDMELLNDEHQKVRAKCHPVCLAETYETLPDGSKRITIQSV